MPAEHDRAPDWFLIQFRRELEGRSQKGLIKTIEDKKGVSIAESTLSKWKSHGRIPPEWINIFCEVLGIEPSTAPKTTARARTDAPHMIPPIGRDEALELIHNNFFAPRTWASLVTIKGDPGSGRSGLAASYWRHMSQRAREEGSNTRYVWIRVKGSSLLDVENEILSELGVGALTRDRTTRQKLIDTFRDTEQVVLVIDLEGDQRALKQWMTSVLEDPQLAAKIRFLVTAAEEFKLRKEVSISPASVSMLGFAQGLLPAMDWQTNSGKLIQRWLRNLPPELGNHQSGLELFLAAVAIQPAYANRLLRRVRKADTSSIGSTFMQIAFEILSARAQDLLIRLAAFDGPFRQDDVAALGDDLLDERGNPGGLIRNLVQLRWLDRQGTGPGTYDGYYLAHVKQRFVHEVVASSKSRRGSHSLNDARARLCVHLTEKAKRSRDELNGPGGARAIERLRCYIPTVRTLWEWCTDEPSRNSLGIALLVAWWHLFEAVGKLPEWERRFSALLRARLNSPQEPKDGVTDTRAASELFPLFTEKTQFFFDEVEDALEVALETRERKPGCEALYRAVEMTTDVILTSGERKPDRENFHRAVEVVRDAVLTSDEPKPCCRDFYKAVEMMRKAELRGDELKLYCEAFYREAIALTRANQFHSAEHWLQLCLRLSIENKDLLGEARARARLAVVWHAVRRDTDCKIELESARRLFKEHYGRTVNREAARTEYWWARHEWSKGRDSLDACENCLKKSLELYREVGDMRGQADVLSWVSRCYWCRGQISQAYEFAETALRYAEVVGGRVPRTQAQMMLGLSLATHPDVSAERRKQGLRALEEAAADLANEGDRWWGAWLLAEMSLTILRVAPQKLEVIKTLMTACIAMRKYDGISLWFAIDEERQKVLEPHLADGSSGPALSFSDAARIGIAALEEFKATQRGDG